MDHITKIVFEPGEYTKILEGMNISQWDQGRKLQFDGLDVEKEIEVHFSLSETGGTAPRVPAEIKEGSVYADIPAFITENEGACGYGCYMAYAFVYLFDGDAAVTVHKAAFKVRMRPKPDDYAGAGGKDVIQALREGLAGKLNISGHEPDKYLGTDQEGNVIVKEAPKGSKTDASLTMEGEAADAKAAGDAIRRLEKSVEDLKEDVGDAELLLASI